MEKNIDLDRKTTHASVAPEIQARVVVFPSLTLGTASL